MLWEGSEQGLGRPEHLELRTKGRGCRVKGEQGLEHQGLVGYIKNLKISESSKDSCRGGGCSQLQF